MLSTQEIDLIASIIKPKRYRLKENSESTDAENKLYDKLHSSLLLKQYTNINYYRSFSVLESNDFANLLLVRVTYKSGGGSRYSFRSNKYSELQLIGLKSLKNKFGNILFRPETMEDKLKEIFSKTEIDFEDYPLFSSNYHLTADNEMLCKSFSTDQRIKLIENQNEIYVQVMDDLLIAKYCRSITPEDFSNLIDFLKGI